MGIGYEHRKNEEILKEANVEPMAIVGVVLARDKKT